MECVGEKFDKGGCCIGDFNGIEMAMGESRR